MRGKKGKQLLDNVKGTRRYWRLKQEAAHRTLWITRFWRDCSETDYIMMMMMMRISGSRRQDRQLAYKCNNNNNNNNNFLLLLLIIIIIIKQYTPLSFKYNSPPFFPASIPLPANFLFPSSPDLLQTKQSYFSVVVHFFFFFHSGRRYFFICSSYLSLQYVHTILM